MQPNQNMQDNAGGASATNGTFNANNTSESPKENIMTAGAKKEKSSKGMLLGLILFAVLAVGGIGFGVWAMLDGNTRADSLNTQISTLKTQNSELMEQLGQTSTGDGDTVINIDTDTDIDTADYIYVGEWGLKIKIPVNLKNVSYKFVQDEDATKLIVWGVDCSDDECQYLPEFANADKNGTGMGNVYRYPKGKEVPLASPPTLVFSDESYDYYSYHLHALYSADNPNSEESDWDSASTDLIWNTLTNPDNYLKF